MSVIGLGTWQLGADWGEVTDADALATLEAAAQAGVTFLDTADVYGDGRSERLIGRFLAANPGLKMMVATKMGRRVALDGLAEDLTAESFLAAVHAVRKPGAADPSIPWLIGVARHKLADHWRRVEREQRGLRLLGSDPARADDPWEAAVLPCR